MQVFKVQQSITIQNYHHGDANPKVIDQRTICPPDPKLPADKPGYRKF